MRRRQMLIGASACAAIAQLGCASTPPEPSTPTRGFGAEEFFLSDPRMLRAATLGDARVTVQSVDLDLRARSPDNQQARYVIRLQRPMNANARLAEAPPGQRWQVFTLDDESVMVYETVRNLLATLPRGSGYAIDVRVDVTAGLVPAGLSTKLPLRIDLMTDPRSGWFTLREATFDAPADPRPERAPAATSKPN